ncbi:hypothetical protein AB4Y44_20190 [Paraburkholderia sp. BR10937]|uniref:hypothetical protein n=1 Tax=Paraburkholderia sp. BR10937 TaxID=3236994 RepID=UPI0034D2842A
MVLRAQSVGLPLDYAPMVMVVMIGFFSGAAYPAGAVTDYIRPRTLLLIGVALLVAADMVLAPEIAPKVRIPQIQATTGKPLAPEQLRRIAPTHLEGINQRGTFNFPVARYAHRILPSLDSDL